MKNDETENVHNHCFILIVSVIRPVMSTRIISFYARREIETVILEWSTEAESNLDKFIIQRSKGNANWTDIGETAATGKALSIQSYQLIDYNLPKTTDSHSNNYYRLVLTDSSGSKRSTARGGGFKTPGGAGGLKVGRYLPSRLGSRTTS